MSEEKKRLIDETVENLKHLDFESLVLMKSGTELLKTRDELERQSSGNQTQDEAGQKEV